MGDLLGSPRVAPLIFVFYFVNFFYDSADAPAEHNEAHGVRHGTSFLESTHGPRGSTRIKSHARISIYENFHF